MNKSIIFYIILLLAVTGCAGKAHPKMLSFTPASVIIDYTDNDLHEATAMAQQYCSSIDKNAQYVRTEEGGFFSGLTGRTRQAFFNCIESNKNLNNNGAGNLNNGPMPIINNFK